MAVSRYSASAGYLMARCQYLGEDPIVGGLYAALSSTEIDDSDLETEFLADMDSFTEYDGSYTRPQIEIVDILPGQQWRLRAIPTDFGEPGEPSDPELAAVAIVLYQGTSELPLNDDEAHVVGWFQGEGLPFLPFTGDGLLSLKIYWPSGGVVLQGPNCG